MNHLLSVLLLCTPIHFILCSTLPSVACQSITTKTAATSPPPEQPPTLIFFAELCRHGDRAPLTTFPTSPLPLEDWPEGPGQLTSVGERAHYELGQRLRRKYIDEMKFLSPSYNRTEIYVRSTDVDRTLMSAYSQLMGLYPEGTASTYDVREMLGNLPLSKDQSGIPGQIQLIPVHTENVNNDMMLLPGKNCLKHDQIMKTRKASNEFQQKENEESEFLKTVAKIAGVKDEDSFTLYNLQEIADTWVCYKAHSIPLQEGVTDEIYAHAVDISNWLLEFFNRGREVHRLRSGLILNTVREHMALAILQDLNKLPMSLKSQRKKFLFLSAHDTTVAATLAALQIFDGKYPPYNSTIFWHLWKTADNELFVTVEYNGQTFKIPGCSEENCPVNEYEKATKDVTIFGELMREMECLTGVEKLASAFSNWMNGKTRQSKNRQFLDLSTIGEDAATNSSFPLWSTLMITMVVLLAVVSLIAIWRVRSRYQGYFSASDDGKDGILSSETDPLSSRRILT